MTDPQSAPLVSIIMGSDSDWPTMEPAGAILDRLRIPYETDVVSAHRTPDKMVRFGRAAADRGIRVIIAGAGGAAHLPGMVASLTTLPVIGVPVQLARLDGLDSLLSIVQMPAGIPVATMAINGAANAGLLAARIIGTSDEAVSARLAEYAASLETVVEEKAAALRRARQDSPDAGISR
ncbi:5-(carboxyamino)imidazole ribonucleotide mutase [Curtobacterium ammoniigenes]|uniref:5-(carboxyamino)imidazole ribonucleotide mutase n=1 Tax=Curtobacterium ammoniigenes TaxID=395387 RepID=UPI00082ABA76|nr:5-(carboxyamino)imidazole ribonucleotide mutase [Curtobacterium ammoniigenes]